MSAKFLSTRVMVMIVLVAFLAAGKARNGNFMPTLFRYMIGLSALPTLADKAYTYMSLQADDKVAFEHIPVFDVCRPACHDFS